MRPVGWPRRRDLLPTWSLRRKIIGLIGFGLIPRYGVRKGQGFEPNFLVYDPYVDTGSSAAFTQWTPAAAEFRRSEQFRQLIHSWRILDYWQAHGFPAFCRPARTDDFVCDDPR